MFTLQEALYLAPAGLVAGNLLIDPAEKVICRHMAWQTLPGMMPAQALCQFCARDSDSPHNHLLFRQNKQEQPPQPTRFPRRDCDKNVEKRTKK